MNCTKLLFLLSLILFYTGVSGETVYKGTDAQGNTIYSDHPMDSNAEKITITVPESSYHLPPVQHSTQSTKNPASEEESIAYNLHIVEPKDQETFTNDITSISVKLSLTPKLHSDDRINLVINGQPYGNYSQSLSFSLNDFPRGAYSIQAVITSVKAPEKIKAQSQTITIYQQRAIARQNVSSNLAPQAPSALHN
ncbi:MAG: DUF4124 domain-containing protein [Proteobacteria bacterium]|nr:DUF4124 domain-containing protein [Pseudomonadota bacterium]